MTRRPRPDLTPAPQAPPSPLALGRRDFILAAGGALTLLGAASCTLLKLQPPGAENGLYFFNFLAYPALQSVGGITVAGPVQIGRYEGNIFIKRVSESDALVLGAKCRHLGCNVDWQPVAKQFLCPCHYSQYGPEGQLLKGPARHPLFAWRARVESDRITLDPRARPIQA